jgi:hypothetical protein
MAVFTTNQVRHFYVANSIKEGAEAIAQKGDIKVCQDKDGKIYLEYYGAGGPVRSDLMDPKNGISLTYTAGIKQVVKTKKATVTLPTGITPTIGQDYVIRIKVNGYYAPANEPSLFQFGVVHVTSETKDKEAFYKAMADSLNANVNKGENKLFNITGSAAGLEIEEADRSNTYKRGKVSIKPLNFEVYCGEVNALVDSANGIYETMTWGDVKWSEGSVSYSNSFAIADMEHFYMGERGDVYRDNVAKIGLDTEYMTTPSMNVSYDTLDIHYAFTDTGTESYRSEKDIIIVGNVASNIKTTIEGMLNPKV